jgi:hypothetical protein
MGLILDSSVIAAKERKGVSVVDLLAGIRENLGAESVAFSTVSVIELEHGIWRAKDAAQAERRRKFFDDYLPRFRPTRLPSRSRGARLGSTAKPGCKV